VNARSTSTGEFDANTETVRRIKQSLEQRASRRRAHPEYLMRRPLSMDVQSTENAELMLEIRNWA